MLENLCIYLLSSNCNWYVNRVTENNLAFLIVPISCHATNILVSDSSKFKNRNQLQKHAHGTACHVQNSSFHCFAWSFSLDLFPVQKFVTAFILNQKVLSLLTFLDCTIRNKVKSYSHSQLYCQLKRKVWHPITFCKMNCSYHWLHAHFLEQLLRLWWQYHWRKPWHHASL